MTFYFFMTNIYIFSRCFFRMKSINFTVESHFPLLINGKKDQTIRMLFVPDFIVNDKVKIVARRRKPNKEKIDQILFIALVTEIFPVQMKEITLEIARRDGFNTIIECKKKLALLNSKDMVRFDLLWGFVIRFKKITDRSSIFLGNQINFAYVPLF